MGEPGGLPSMGSHRVGQDWSDLAAAADLVILIYINQFQFITVLNFFFFLLLHLLQTWQWMLFQATMTHLSVSDIILIDAWSLPCARVPCVVLCAVLIRVWHFVTPGPSVHGLSQARILEWLPFPSPEHLPDPGIEPVSPALAGRFFTTEPSLKPTRVS